MYLLVVIHCKYTLILQWITIAAAMLNISQFPWRPLWLCDNKLGLFFLNRLHFCYCPALMHFFWAYWVSITHWNWIILCISIELDRTDVDRRISKWPARTCSMKRLFLPLRNVHELCMGHVFWDNWGCPTSWDTEECERRIRPLSFHHSGSAVSAARDLTHLLTLKCYLQGHTVYRFFL